MIQIASAGVEIDASDPTVIIPTPYLPTPATLSSEHLIQGLLQNSIICRRAWDRLPQPVQRELKVSDDHESLLEAMVRLRLLTEYQSNRILSGETFGLVLGNYRLLERLGAGGMGVVFKAEHLTLPRQVAIKLVSPSSREDHDLIERFRSEMWSVAQMQHPNIVGAIDAGQVIPHDCRSTPIHYFVMDFVAGENLEQHVEQHGPLNPAIACDLMYQVASALGEAYKYNLVHRDIKPSNIMVTPEGQAKLLDFGLVRHSSHRITSPGTTVGTVDFLAPEQARNASAVDIRADIYSLGATLYWCLTGESPFPDDGDTIQKIFERLTLSPPLIRSIRTDISPELEAVILRMMATDPNQRYATPQALMRALMPFVHARPTPVHVARHSSHYITSTVPEPDASPASKRVLLVDDESSVRCLYRRTLQGNGVECDEAVNGREALEKIRLHDYDLILCDCEMPELNGIDLLKQLRASPVSANLKIIMFSGRASADEMSQMLALGADDYLTKPFGISQFLSRVNTVLKLKAAEDSADALRQDLKNQLRELEREVSGGELQLREARRAYAITLRELITMRHLESRASLSCVAHYSRRLAETAAQFPRFSAQIDDEFLELLELAASLRDVGLVGIPEYLLLKPGPLDAAERVLMQSHVIIGEDTLLQASQQTKFAPDFLKIAREVVRSHHERIDGTGFPDQLAGDEIPLSARIVAIADTYHTLRSRRPSKPPLTHAETVRAMTETASGQFDPLLWQAFRLCSEDFEKIAKIENPVP